MIATALERAQQWAEKVQRLENENERLRAALQEIANLSSVSYRAPHLARAALEPKP
jgi:cell shape-determining protein MreC